MGITKAQKVEKRIDSVLVTNKFFADKKYWKNNYWNWAAWDSWAATGKAGGCYGCSNDFYNATLANKRAANKFCKEVSPKFCLECVAKIETKLEHKFVRH